MSTLFSLSSTAGKPCCTLKKPERGLSGARGPLGCYHRITDSGADWSRRWCDLSVHNKSRVACPVACGDCKICADHPQYPYYFKLYSGHGRCDWALRPPRNGTAHWGPAHWGPARLGAAIEIAPSFAPQNRQLAEASSSELTSSALEELRSELVGVRLAVDRIQSKLDRVTSQSGAAAAALSPPSDPQSSLRGSGSHVRQSPPQRISADVVVYDATSGGVIAAVAAARHGRSVILLCASWPACFAYGGRQVGGMSSGGLGMTDVCYPNPYARLQQAKDSLHT